MSVPDSPVPDPASHFVAKKVLITDYAWPTLELEAAALPGVELVVAHEDDVEMARQAGEVDAILTCWRKIPPAVLDAATRCRVVVRYGIGVDNIPLEHATLLGIPVANVPDFCLDEVSDHALGLLLACARKIVDYSHATRTGRWALHAGRPMRRLRGQTLGLVGYGNIAQRLATKARALGMEIVAYTPRLAADALAPWGKATNDLYELLGVADFVSLHVPLTSSTAGMIDGEALRAMKPTAFLINTARGGIINEAALIKALAEEWIAGAALDVLTVEPPPPDHPLLLSPKVIATPHAAFVSMEATAELIQKAAANVAAVLRGELPSSLVNPEVVGRPNFRLESRTPRL